MPRTPRPILALAVGLLALSGTVVGAVRNAQDGRFDHLHLQREGGVIAVSPERVASLPADDPLRREWDRVTANGGGGWRVWLDQRSALPALVTLPGIAWDGDAERLATRAEEFLRGNSAVLGQWGDQLVFDAEASGARGPDVRLVSFSQVVDGVPVEGARFEFHVSHGKLVAFGATRWAPVTVSATPLLSADHARARLEGYVRPASYDGIADVAEPELLLLPLNATPGTDAWSGTRGQGYAHRLIWRFRFTDVEHIATWTGEIDAHTGEVVAFYDDTRYDRATGHVNPISDDGLCTDQGCPVAGYPLPYTDISEDGGAAQFSGQHGLYSCTPGSTIETTLNGQYFLMSDQCGAISETAVCGDDLDLGVADDINCGVAAGASAGNTDAARSSYYALNLVNRKARFWLPGNTWLENTQVECRTNTGGGCNASWSGTINMQAANAFCGNTGQLQGLVVHEWGHGLDDNDGGGDDNPGETYADVVAVFEARESCIARGFNIGINCDGYGDTCLTCTGLREMDWDARKDHTPATPTGYLNQYCGNGGGPCGKEIHCESHLGSEAIFDLATRDLPAMGLDLDSAWQLAERLWYQSRAGSGGEIYNCSISMGTSDSCGVGSWYHQLRLVDDDDGNLNNGTPHAAAIFAAFDRHDIACGNAGDNDNQNNSSCPTLDVPVLTFTAQSNAVALDWDPVANADAYRVYRNENGCHRAQFPIVETDSATTAHLDSGLANGLPVFYRVQAIGSTAACESPVSACVEAGAQQLAGELRFDRVGYGCSATIELAVTDLNHPSASMAVTIWSDTEGVAESVTLNETSVGSARYTGTILTTTSAAAADGMLSVNDGDTITARYVDLDDGEGGINVPQQVGAVADCSAPLHLVVAVNEITETSARIDWTSSETTRSTLEWGSTPALGNVIDRSIPDTDHFAVIGPLTACSRVYFRVTSTDAVGNVAVADVQGAPFEFNAFQLQGIVLEDGFETNAGWTLQGEWEIGAPQGLGTAPGDPTAASEGSQVLGHDLSGQGSNPGDYEFNTQHSATSPVIDTSALTGVELQIDRWLNYQSSGTARLQAKTAGGAWQDVWTHTTGLTSSEWTTRTYDISSIAAGNPSLQIRFFQDARFGINAGWNVDRMVLRDTTVPSYGACGGCTGAPTFAGVVSVTDDSCTVAGLSVDWVAAPAWGTGAPGSYTVYRDTTPGFTPGPANEIATGVVGTSWSDTTAPAGVQVYYVVRAENDETCGTGPNNGGLMDANLAEAGATDVVGAPPPGNVGDTLRVDVNGSAARLTWSSVVDAVRYNVYRAPTADTGFAVLAQPTAALYDDAEEPATGQGFFYRITSVNACGDESAQ